MTDRKTDDEPAWRVKAREATERRRREQGALEAQTVLRVVIDQPVKPKEKPRP